MEPIALRAQLAARMGYDPFEQPGATERVSVVLGKSSRGFAARIERWNAAGVRTLDDTFPMRPMRSCEALTSPLASYLRAALLSGVPEPSTRPSEAPPREPEAPPGELEPPPAAARAPSPPPAVAAPPPPEPRDVPNPSRNVAKYTPLAVSAPVSQATSSPAPVSRSNRAALGVALGGYALSAVFLCLGIGYTVDAQRRENETIADRQRAVKMYGKGGCAVGGPAPSDECESLVQSAQVWRNALGLRNTFYALAGVAGMVGVGATPWAVGAFRSQTNVRVNMSPGGVIVHGTF